MTTEEKEAKIAALRGTLKDGRVNQAGANPGSDYGNDDSQVGATFQDAGREVSNLDRGSRKAGNNYRAAGGNGRSAEEKPLGLRPATRRSGEGDSSVADDPTGTESIRTVGRFLTEDPIPTRKEKLDIKPDGVFSAVVSDGQSSNLSSKYPELDAILSVNPDIPVRQLGEKLGVGKDTAAKLKKDWADSHQSKAPAKEKKFELPSIKGRVLSAKEVEEYKESFAASLESDFQALDTYLWHRQGAVGIEHHEQPIWSDVDAEEIEALTRVMLRWGQRNEVAAATVRGVVESSDYIAVGTVFIPRVSRTVKVMRETRKPPVRRVQRRENQD